MHSMLSRVVSVAAVAAAMVGSSAFGGIKVSVMGDSYSTFRSWGASYYPTGDVQEESQQWWAQVIAGIDGAQLEVNASWSGAKMSGATTFSSFLCRARLIGNPDLILICGAMNDDWNNVATATFEQDVELLFRDLDRNHPLARKYFVLNAENASGRPGLKPTTCASVKKLCAAHGYPVVDLTGVLDCSSSADYANAHPTAAGMTKIANAVLAKYADCETNGYPARADETVTSDPSGLFVANDTTFATADSGDEVVVTFTNISHEITLTATEPLAISRLLVVGGGGAGGYTIGGGGGGGEVVDVKDADILLGTGETVRLVVGQGGYDPTTRHGDSTSMQSTWCYNHANGGASSVTIDGQTFTALGGGAGASWRVTAGSAGANGGGGSAGAGSGGAGGAALAQGGFAGGSCYPSGVNNDRAPGGGGGAGGPGGTPTSASKGGDGGPGVVSDITGADQVYGSGGGAGIGNNTTTPGVGGTNAGSGAATISSKGGAAKDGFGGGGGGGGYNSALSPNGLAGGAGGNGTVILRLSRANLEPTPLPLVYFRGIQATERTRADYLWRFGSKGQVPEGAELVSCVVSAVCTDQTTARAVTNVIGTAALETPATYEASFERLAPGRAYTCQLFAVSRYREAGGQEVEYKSEVRDFAFTTEAEPSCPYREYTYLESSGTQYIKTGVYPSAGLRAAGAITLLSQPTLTGGGWMTIFGYFKDTNNGWCLWSNSSNGWQLNFNCPAILKGPAMTVGSTYEFETSGSALTVNGKTYGSGTSYSCSQADLPLFAFYAPQQGGYTTCSSHVRVLAFKLWNEGGLQRDFVPVQRLSDGAKGLYDLVGQSFYANDGTGEFIVGDEVTHGGRLVTSFAATDCSFDGSVLQAMLTQQGGAAGTIRVCYGSDYGGDEISGWQHEAVAGAFAAGENAVAAVLSGLPTGTCYARFYSEAEEAWSETLYLPDHTIVPTPQPVLAVPTFRSATPASATFQTRLLFVGTGAESCDVFAVLEAEGTAVTNTVATGVCEPGVLDFSFGGLRPASDYTVKCFADNGLEDGQVETASLAFTTEGENCGNVLYREVSSLESTGTQYLKTGVTPFSTMRIAGKIQVISQPKLTGGGWMTVFGYFKSVTDGFCLWSNSGQNWQLCFNSPSILKTIKIDTLPLCEFETSGASMTVNGTTYRSTDSYSCSQSPDLPIFAFYAPDNGGYTTCGSKVDVRWFKIFDGDTVVRDFIPVVGKDGKAGLYDLVRGEFHGNAGSGDFLYGNPVAETRLNPHVTQSDVTYDGTTLSAHVAHAAPCVSALYACWGAEYGGDDTNGWQHCVRLTDLTADGTPVTETLVGLGTETKYVRFYSAADQAWTTSIYMPDVAVEILPEPILSALAVSDVTAASATVSSVLEFAGTGDPAVDVFAVWTSGGETHTNVVATGAATGDALTFRLAPLCPGRGYEVFFLAANALPGGTAVTAPVAFTASELGVVREIPSDAQAIDYLESNGSQYILTGVTPSKDLRISGRYVHCSQGTLTGDKWITIFGYFASTSDGICLFSSSDKLKFNNPPTRDGPNVTVGGIYDFSTSGASLTVNGSTFGSSATYSCSQSPDLPLFAFYAPNHGGYITCNSHVRLCSFRIDDGDTTLRDFVPVLDPSGVACFYDLVEKKYHYNAGGGSFTAGPVQTGVLYIEGVPEPYGTAYPSYGAHIGIADGLRFTCTAPASYDAGDLTAVCTGWKLFEKQAGEWVEVESGDGTSTVITHNASVDRALRWQYAVRSAAGLADFAVDSVSVGKATFSGRVTGIGQTSDSAEVRIVCGYSADSLFLTNAVADVTGICGWSGSVAGLEPGRSYVAKAVLVNSAGETVESAPVSFTTEPLPASKTLPEGYAPIPYLQSDGRQRIDTGIVPGRDTAVDFSFQTLGYKNDTTFFGARDWNHNQYLFIEQDANGQSLRFYGDGDVLAPFEANADGRLVLTTDGTATVTVGNRAPTTVTGLELKNDSGANLQIFAVLAGHGGSWRFKAMRIEKGGETVRDFVPVSRLADGVTGLYDLVDGGFYTSTTTVQFPKVACKSILTTRLTDDGIALTFAPSTAVAEVFCAAGDDYAGEDAAAWASVTSVGMVAADAVENLVAFPSGWGDELRFARCFTVQGGVTNWGAVVHWIDPTLPALADCAADGTGGDALVVRGTLASLGDASSAKLKVFVGTSPDGMSDWGEIDGSTVSAAGEFALTLFESDTTSARAIRPETDYWLVVEAVAGGKVVRSETLSVRTRGRAVVDSATASCSQRTLTAAARLGFTGANVRSTVRLFVGEQNSEAALVQVGEPIEVATTEPFEMTHDVASFAKTYYWQLRFENVTTDGTVLETRTAVQSVTTVDAAVYTWNPSVAAGNWSDSANWTSDRTDCVGYPNSASASAVFAANTTAAVTMTEPVSVTKLDIGAANLDLVFRGGTANRITATTVVIGTQQDFALRASRLELDGAAISTVNHVYLGNGSHFIVSNGGDFSTSQHIHLQLDLQRNDGMPVTNRFDVVGRSTVTVNGIGLAGGTVFTVDDSTVTMSFVVFNEHVGGGWLRVMGRNPLLKGTGGAYGAGNSSQNQTGGYVFTVPKGGYAAVPCQFTGGARSFGTDGDEKMKPFKIYLDPKSPACGTGKPGAHLYPLVTCANAIAPDRIGFVTRGREGDGFFYSLQKAPPQTWVEVSTYTTSADKPLAIAVSFETVPFKLILR